MSGDLGTEFAARRHARCRHPDGTLPHRHQRRRASTPMWPSPPAAASRPILSLATDILAREPRSRFTLDLRQPQHFAHHVSGGNAGAEKPLHRAFCRALRDEPRAAADGMAQRADRRPTKSPSWRSICPRSRSADEYLICGPGDMVDEVRNALKALNGTAPIRFERFATAARAAAAKHSPEARRAASIGARAPAQEVSWPTDHGRHGRPAAQLSDGARRCLRARRGGTGGPRAAVLLPFGHLRHLPRAESPRARRS